MKKCNLIRKILAVFLILTFLVLSGCDNNSEVVTSGNAEDSSQTSSNQNNNTVSDGNDASSKDEVVSSEESKISVAIDPLNGKFSNTGSITGIADDADEILPTGNPAYLSTPLTGYADKEADTLRKEILNTKNTEEYYKIKGTKYYVSTKGNDSNPGTSPEKPLRTIDGLAGINLESGDAVLFERGCVFRITQAIMAVEGVTYGSYGKGDKPKIYASPKNFATAEWTPSPKANVWQTSFVYDPASNLIINHGEQVGFMKLNIRDLSMNNHYYCDETNGVFYMYCDKGNPSKVYKSIEIPTKTFIFHIYTGVDNVTVDNLCLKYSGWIAVNGHSDNDNIIVTNCEIGYIGGAYSPGHMSRLGNAVQVWAGCVNGKFDHNWIYQTFDSALSWQNTGDQDCRYENISFSDNLLEFNNADIEVWDTDSTVKNFRIENNIMRFTSLGWGTRKADGGIRGIEGCIFGNLSDLNLENFICKNNILDCPAREIISMKFLKTQLPTLHISGTKVYYKSSYRTTTLVFEGDIKNTPQDNNKFLSANNKQELLDALKIFDPTVYAEWYD